MNIASDASALNISVTGDAACFRRPEFADDMISYDVMPPAAALRLLNAAYSPGPGHWKLKRLRVINPIVHRWGSIDGARGRKRATLLIDVSYVISAELVGCAAAPGIDEIASAVDSCRDPYLGLSELRAHLALLDDVVPASRLVESPPIDLGWMVYDHNGIGRARTRYFRPWMLGGDIDLSPGAIGPLAS